MKMAAVDNPGSFFTLLLLISFSFSLALISCLAVRFCSGFVVVYNLFSFQSATLIFL